VNIELRPLRLGEILDRTFQLYRARFGLFLGIAATSTILELLWSALQLGETSLLSRGYIVGPVQQVITTATAIGGWAFGFGCAALATAAINRAVHSIYEGNAIGIVAAYRAVRNRWLPCIWANILGFFIAWSPVIVVVFSALMSVALAKGAKSLMQANAVTFVYGFAAIAAVIAIPLCVWLSLRYSLAIPACIQENIGTLRSLKRSVLLSRESRGRIFVLLLVVGAAWMVLLMALMIPTFALLAKSRGHMSPGLTMYTLAVSFLCNTLMKPIYGIGLTLFYYDARVRKEGYDVEWMLEHSALPETLISAEPLTGSQSTPAEIIVE
jgi:hypothetical protein